MSMGFKDILAADVSNVFTNSDEFGEPLSYQPKNGAARSVNGVVDHEGGYQDQSFGESNIEVLDVFVSRDDTTGIDDPQLGDRIARADGRWFAFSGQKLETDESSWTLRFTRDIPTKHGGLPTR